MYYELISDEATDSATKEQISLCVRYFELQYKTVHEDFLCFVEADKTTGEATANKFMTELKSVGIVVAEMRALKGTTVPPICQVSTAGFKSG